MPKYSEILVWLPSPDSGLAFTLRVATSRRTSLRGGNVVDMGQGLSLSGCSAVDHNVIEIVQKWQILLRNRQKKAPKGRLSVILRAQDARLLNGRYQLLAVGIRSRGA